MDEIRVNTADLRNGSQNLELASEELNACMGRLMSCSQGIDRGRDKGQFAGQVQRLLDDSHGMCIQRQNQMEGLSQELLRRAGLFEAANEAGASASLRVNGVINDFWGKDNMLTRFSEWAKHQNLLDLYNSGVETGKIAAKITLAALLATSFHVVKNRPNSFAMSGKRAIEILGKVVPVKTLNNVLKTAGNYIPGVPKPLTPTSLRNFLEVGKGTVQTAGKFSKTMAQGMARGLSKAFAPLEIALDLGKETIIARQREGSFSSNFFKTALVDGAARLAISAAKVGVIIGIGALVAAAPVAAPVAAVGVLTTYILGPILIDKFVADPLMDKWRTGKLRNELVKDPINATKSLYNSVTSGAGELVKKADDAFRPHIDKLMNIFKLPFQPSPV